MMSVRISVNIGFRRNEKKEYFEIKIMLLKIRKERIFSKFKFKECPFKLRLFDNEVN